MTTVPNNNGVLGKKRKAENAKDGITSSSSSSINSSNTTDNVSVGYGEVFSFGSGDMSQLGLGEADNMRERKKPTLVTALSSYNVKSIAAGSLHNAVIMSDGSIWTWGCNDDNALGRQSDEWLPAPVEGPLGKATQFIDVTIESNDTIITSTQPKRTKTPETSSSASTPFINRSIIPSVTSSVIQVCCGASHTIALTSSGVVYCWGTYRDANGVLGFSPTMDTATTPYRFDTLKDRVIMIAAGEHHDVVLTDRGEVYQWGDVGFGKKFTERHKKNKLYPTIVPFKKNKLHPTKINIVGVYAGGASSFAITKEGKVFSWGPNNYGQTGHPSIADEEERKEEEDNMKQSTEMTSGNSTMITITNSTTDTNSTEIAQPATKKQRKKKSSGQLVGCNSITSPTLITAIPEPIIKIAAAIHHTLFLSASHRVHVIGKNQDGRLGLGHNKNISLLPSIIPSLSNIIDIGIGEAHSLFIDQDYHLYSCGMGELLQLGHGIEEDLNVPTLVQSKQLDEEGGRNVIAAAGGSQHTLILTTRRNKQLTGTASARSTITATTSTLPITTTSTTTAEEKKGE